MTVDPFSIPPAAWQRRLDAPLVPGGRPSRLSLRAIPLRRLPFFLSRVSAGARRRRAAGWDAEDVLLTASSQRAPGPHQGVPLGGIGAGTIGRGWRGEFRRWQRRPGIYHHGVVWADQFSLFVQRPGQPAQAQVLHPERPPGNLLSAWRWNMNPSCAVCHALYPRAWTVYDQPLPGVRLVCRQLSPVIPHNYRESSYPTGEFRWRIENTGPDEATVALMFTFQNGPGAGNELAGGHSNAVFQLPLTAEQGAASVSGVALRHLHRQPRAVPLDQAPAEPHVYEEPLTYAVAACSAGGGDVSYRARFDAYGTGAGVWQDFAQDGRLDNVADPAPSKPGEAIGAALAVTITVPPGGSREVAFALSWDMPSLRSGFGTVYHPHYSRFYGTEGDAAPRLARDTLLHSSKWEAQIAAWQEPILSDPGLPAWYKMALFNELYYIADGGTWWVHPHSAMDGIDESLGHFGYLEGHEYRMVNTYDVHFYASFALAMLWPRLELALQRDIAAATLAEDLQPVAGLWSGKPAPRKVCGAVPHDLGWPDEDPWRLVNGYNLHDTNRWKDLNPKFVLQVYRDFIATGDTQFVADVWPAVEAAMAYATRFDRDDDGLIENDGEPDQTYDTWTVAGASAYSGGLWLASLSAAAALAEVVGRAELAAGFRTELARGQAAYQQKLWNGRYFNYDSSANSQRDSIMADQLAGQWYARACGLPPIVEPEQVRSALQAVFQANVLGFGRGELGAVNGMRPSGQVDGTSMQSQEVWAGTTYALAAAMLLEGLVQEAWKTAEGIVRTTYERMGYWFQTPEAWDKSGNYRSIAYMRPLAIWAIQWAWERQRRSKVAPVDPL